MWPANKVKALIRVWFSTTKGKSLTLHYEEKKEKICRLGNIWQFRRRKVTVIKREEDFLTHPNYPPEALKHKLKFEVILIHKYMYIAVRKLNCVLTLHYRSKKALTNLS